MSNGNILSSYSLLQSAENKRIPDKYLTKNSSVKIIDEGKSITKKKHMTLEDLKMKISVDAEDFPSGIDPHAPIIITGVESEEVDEINEAYADILAELGNYLKDLFCSR